jgi:Asp-tRNA(Asn)/Glu-tRNA(Gln) amidotransferase A subunit family amidase
MSAADLVRAHLARIDRITPALNAFVDVRADQALAEAAAQDAAAVRGVPRGALGGLPVTVKSAIDVAGVRCETGSPTRRGRVAATDATVVARLRQAGAIVLGTTNVAEMLMAYETVNPLHGLTRNPWDPTRTPGGSSGGEAVAIATGCSGGGIGSDGGGSIRVPAHFSGICGFKPTPGRVPTTGHQPACLGPFSIVGVVGPMARTVADLRLLDEALSGYDVADPMAVPHTEGRRQKAEGRRQKAEGRRQKAEGRSRQDLRVAFFEDDGVVPVTAETRAAIRGAARAAADAGLTIEEYRPPALADAARIWDVFFPEAALLALHAELGGVERELPILHAYLERPSARASAPAVGAASQLSAAQLIDAWAARDRLRAEFDAQLGPARVLICPVAATPAFEHGQRSWNIEGTPVSYLESMRYSQSFNVLGTPAVAVPVAASADGLPIGVQVVGRRFDDALVLDVAGLIEQASGGYQPPPGFDD